MGKAIVLVFFVGAFIVFAIIKAAFFGAKEAYNVVFNPNANDEKVKQVIAQCYAGVFGLMEKHYNGNSEALPGIVVQLTPLVQSTILEQGYQVTRDIAESIVINAIVTGGYATMTEIENA